jgi:hypothetical protein
MRISSPSKDPAAARATMWLAIHEAAATVGAIAGLDRSQVGTQIDRGLVVCLGSDLSARLSEDLQDLADILQRGISALLTAHTSGGAPQAAARALWLEFVEARDALLSSRDQSGDTATRA